LGLGWPMVYVVFVAAGRKTRSGRPRAIRLEPEHAVEIVGLVPPLLYFAWIVLKQRFTWVDAVVLIGLYLVYLWVLFRNPVRDPDQVGDLPAISRWAYTRRGWRQRAAIGGLFAAGGSLLYATAHPFLESMLAVAALLGFGQFFLVQWVAQFVRPDMREEVAVAYALWMTILAIGFAVRGKTLLAPKYFWETVRK